MAKKKIAAVEALESMQAKPPQCQADVNCEEPAVGAQRVCLKHQVAQQDISARAKCDELGLHTVDQMRAWCKKKRTWWTPDREPGSDEEENRETARKLVNGEVTVGREP